MEGNYEISYENKHDDDDNNNNNNNSSSRGRKVIGAVGGIDNVDKILVPAIDRRRSFNELSKNNVEKEEKGKHKKLVMRGIARSW